MISFKNVSVSKNGNDILKDVTVSLGENRIGENRIGIIGHNGSGKSTFAKLMNGLEDCTEGDIIIQHDDVDAHQSARKTVGFMFQNPDNQIVFSIVEEDIAYGLKKSGLSKAEIKSKVRQYLDRFGLSHLHNRFTHELSGGEKQLVALIGVLIMDPKYIVLDEPTTLLDLKNRSMLLNALQSLEQTLIVVSHDLEFMGEMDRLIFIHNGGIHADGKPEEVLKTYRKISQC